MDLPSNIYDETDININVMFSTTSAEFITFYDPVFGDCFDLNGFGSDFNVTYPFRGIDVNYSSPVCSNFVVLLKQFSEFDAIDSNGTSFLTLYFIVLCNFVTGKSPNSGIDSIFLLQRRSLNQPNESAAIH